MGAIRVIWNGQCPLNGRNGPLNGSKKSECNIPKQSKRLLGRGPWRGPILSLGGAGYVGPVYTGQLLGTRA